MKISKEELLRKIEKAPLVLVGIGEEFDYSEEKASEIRDAYSNLYSLIGEKNFFIISTCTDGLILDSGFSEDRIVRPLIETESDEIPNWEKYSRWLTATLNRDLLILELGVGLKYPDIIRFPFEKVAFYNMKSDFVRVHHMLYQMPEELGDKGNSININAVSLLSDLEN